MTGLSISILYKIEESEGDYDAYRRKRFYKYIGILLWNKIQQCP